MNKDEFIKLLENAIIPGDCTDWTPYMQPLEDALMEILPASLYRFRSINEYSLSALDKNQIFFSRAKDFNDPYDTLISSNSFECIRQCDMGNLSAFMNIMGDLLAEGMAIPQNIIDLFPKNSLDSMVECIKLQVKDAEFGNREEPNWQETFTKLNDIVTNCERVLRNNDSYACFSENIKSMTMWAHYADYHRGYALSYDIKPLILSRLKGLWLFPVIYSATRYEATNLLGWTTAQSLNLPMTRFDQLDKIKSALYKSLDWEYEKEWRLINTIDQDNPHPSLIYAPTGIFYGSRISEINKKILHNIAIEKGLQEYEMHIDQGSSSYEMQIRPFSVANN